MRLAGLSRLLRIAPAASLAHGCPAAWARFRARRGAARIRLLLQRAGFRARRSERDGAARAPLGAQDRAGLRGSSRVFRGRPLFEVVLGIDSAALSGYLRRANATSIPAWAHRAPSA